MNTKRIVEIQKETAYPDSISVQQALLKVWNECEQEKVVKNNAVLPRISTNLSYLDIELAIAKHYDTRQHIIVPNCYINFGTSADHECDLLIIKKSGYAEEIEIKMSKSDFKADFKKKHDHVDERLQHLYYAMPINVYEQCKELIPDYAGIYVIRKNLTGKAYASCVKNAPKKECRKLTESEQLKIARLGVMRIWNMKQKFQCSTS